jgi:hypothetical protein
MQIPTNFSLIQMNEDKGGARSSENAKALGEKWQPGERSAQDSVNSKGEVQSELTDLSWSQSKTQKESTKEEDEKARELLGKFGQLNAVRAVLIGAGGVVGLLSALAA